MSVEVLRDFRAVEVIVEGLLVNGFVDQGEMMMMMMPFDTF